MHNLSRLETAVFMLVVNNDIDELESHYREPNLINSKLSVEMVRAKVYGISRQKKYALYLEISLEI